MLDEPSLGLAPILVSRDVRDRVASSPASGTTILLVEQMARQALAIADRAYVLSGGRVIREGAASDVANADDVRTAYLGVAAAS